MENKKLIDASLCAELSARVVTLSCRTDDIKRLAKAVVVLAQECRNLASQPLPPSGGRKLAKRPVHAAGRAPFRVQ
jgi:hypothetical protein